MKCPIRPTNLGKCIFFVRYACLASENVATEASFGLVVLEEQVKSFLVKPKAAQNLDVS